MTTQTVGEVSKTITTAEPDKEDFDGFGLGKPVVQLPKESGDVHVYVTNTNPLLYTVKQTGGEQKARDEIAALSDVFKATGSLITEAVAAAGERSADGVSKMQAKAKMKSARLPRPGIPPSAPHPIDAFSKTLGTRINDVLDKESSIETSARNAADQITVTTLLSTKLISAAQQAEIGGEPKLDSNSMQVTPTGVDAAFDTLAVSYRQLSMQDVDCAEVVKALKRMADTKLAGFGNDAAGVAARDAFTTDFKTVIAGLACSGNIAATARDLATWLHDASNAPAEDALAGGDERDALVAVSELGRRYNDVLTRRDTMLTDAATALNGRITAIVAASKLHLNQKIFTDATGANPCGLRAGVLEVDRPLDTAANLAISDNATETIHIDTRPGASDLTLTHPAPVDLTYTLTRRLGKLFDVDVALVYTKLTDPTYDLEAVPASTSSSRVVALEDPAKKRIILKSESSRAGQLAALVTFNTLSKSLHPQFGAAVSTDHPGIFAGLAYAPIKYMKISGGWTLQQVTKLPNGQHVGTEVPGTTAAVQTRKGFSGKWYAALSVTLNGLSFFNK